MSDSSGDVLRLELVYANENREAALLQRFRSENPITPSEQRFLTAMLDDKSETEFKITLTPRSR